MDDKLIGIATLGIIACLSMWLLPDAAEKIVVPIVTGIGGLVTGRLAK